MFISNMQTLIAELRDPDSPAFNALAFFDTLCERGRGYNIFCMPRWRIGIRRI